MILQLCLFNRFGGFFWGGGGFVTLALVSASLIILMLELGSAVGDLSNNSGMSDF